MRRVLTPFVLLVVLAGALVGTAPGFASAAPSPRCPAQNGYPYTADATVQVSSTTPRVGSTIEVSGVRYCRGEKITITLDGVTVATATTDATGFFDPPITVTGGAGDKRVCAYGQTRIAANRDCLTIAAKSGGATPDGGGTAFTGVRLGLLIALALVLLAGGLLLARAGRRRRVLA